MFDYIVNNSRFATSFQAMGNSRELTAIRTKGARLTDENG